jgi:hypothetical protein
LSWYVIFFDGFFVLFHSRFNQLSYYYNVTSDRNCLNLGLILSREEKPNLGQTSGQRDATAVGTQTSNEHRASSG